MGFLVSRVEIVNSYLSTDVPHTGQGLKAETKVVAN